MQIDSWRYGKLFNNKNRNFLIIFHLILFSLITNGFALLKPVMTSSTNEIREFLITGNGSAKAKLVFVDYSRKNSTKKLCYLDFTEKSMKPYVHTISAIEGANVPVISPEGNWVVYATGEGSEAGSPVNLRSSVYICRISEDAVPVLVAADSACEPRFVQQDNKLTVIYTTLAPNCAWEGFGKTMSVDINVSGNTPVVGTPNVLFKHGSYTGGLSKDSKYLCGGGRHIAMIDLTGGKTRPDTVSIYQQSCNASISSSSFFTHTMMHLSLGGTHPSINGGKTWKSWQTILINNNKKKILKGYWYPTKYKFPLQTNPESFTEGYARWHHCEWSNHPYFAVATLNTDRFFKKKSDYVNTFFQERIYLINLKDSVYLEVVRPDTVYYSGVESDNSGFHWPWLWVEIPDGFKEDSAWLDTRITAINSKTSNPVLTNTNGSIRFINNTIYSTNPVLSVTLCQLNGRILFKIKPKGDRRRVIIPYNIGNRIYGSYVLHVRLKTGVSKTLYLVSL